MARSLHHLPPPLSGRADGPPSVAGMTGRYALCKSSLVNRRRTDVIILRRPRSINHFSAGREVCPPGGNEKRAALTGQPASDPATVRPEQLATASACRRALALRLREHAVLSRPLRHFLRRLFLHNG